MPSRLMACSVSSTCWTEAPATPVTFAGGSATWLVVPQPGSINMTAATRPRAEAELFVDIGGFRPIVRRGSSSAVCQERVGHGGGCRHRPVPSCRQEKSGKHEQLHHDKAYQPAEHRYRQRVQELQPRAGSENRCWKQHDGGRE